MSAKKSAKAVMSAQHTLTPWAQVSGLITAYSGMVTVAKIATPRAAETPGTERLANGEFIVRACNAHADLVAALRGLLAAVESGDSVPPSDLLAARAALAKVGRQ